MNRWWLALIAAVVTPCLAKEPTNLAVFKQNLMRYHDSGQYEKDTNAVVNRAIQYLSYRLKHKEFSSLKPAVVLDVDETALSNYTSLIKNNFGGTLEEIRAAEKQGQDPAMPATFKLYQFAKKHHLAVFFITGRLEEERAVTERNLREAGYDAWERVIFRTPEYHSAPAATFKTAMRKQLSRQGYDIWLNIGDQESDLVGKYADKTFKVPNPYYFIP